MLYFVGFFFNYEENNLLDPVHVLRLKLVWKMLVSEDQTLDFTMV